MNANTDRWVAPTAASQLLGCTRRFAFVHPDGLADLCLADGELLDVFSEWPCRPGRELRGLRAAVVLHVTAAQQVAN